MQLLELDSEVPSYSFVLYEVLAALNIWRFLPNIYDVLQLYNLYGCRMPTNEAAKRKFKLLLARGCSRTSTLRLRNICSKHQSLSNELNPSLRMT
jgi:hypothetical protein